MVDTANGGDKPQSLFTRLAAFMRGNDSNAQIRETIQEAIEDSDRQGGADLSAPERIMLSNLLKFGELRVKDVMIPRADIIAAEEDMTLPEFFALIREAQHSRMPLYRDTLDDPTGVVHIKDVLTQAEALPDGNFRWKDGPVSQFKRPLLFVPPSMPVLDLLLKMQTAHMHLALVIDEHGGTDGLVSIEDVIEEIVGDIADEHDEEVQQVKKLDDGAWSADARTDLDEFKEQTGIDLATGEDAEGVDTLGGLVASLLGRVPQRGEIVPHPSGYEFEVLEADARRVKRLRIKALPKPEPVRAATEKPA